MGNALKKCMVLIIEPDENILEVLTFALVDEGMEVFGFVEFSTQVIDLLEEKFISIAIIAFRGKGEAAIKILNEIKLYQAIPVLAISCDNDIDLKYKKHGFNGYINKPFDINELAGILYSYL
jgi:DNA-binding NtrC family response regulator